MYLKKFISRLNIKTSKTDIRDLKRKIQLDVCKAGGDIVVPQKNGLGHFVGGSVFRKK